MTTRNALIINTKERKKNIEFQDPYLRNRETNRVQDVSAHGIVFHLTFLQQLDDDVPFLGHRHGELKRAQNPLTG